MMFFRILFFEKRHSYILAIWEDLWCWEHVDDVEMDWCSCFSYMEVQHMTLKRNFLFLHSVVEFVSGFLNCLKSSQLRCRNGVKPLSFGHAASDWKKNESCWETPLPKRWFTIWKNSAGISQILHKSKTLSHWFSCHTATVWETSGIIFWMARYGTNFGNLMIISQSSSQWEFGLRW